jgi:hypothetical protein
MLLASTKSEASSATSISLLLSDRIDLSINFADKVKISFALVSSNKLLFYPYI